MLVKQQKQTDFCGISNDMPGFLKKSKATVVNVFLRDTSEYEV